MARFFFSDEKSFKAARGEVVTYTYEFSFN